MSVLVPAALAALMALAAPELDTVMLKDGGRLRGTVVEETRSGLTIELTDGRVERLLPGQVSRVVYGDGAIGILGGEAAPTVAPAAPAPPAPPVAAPAPPAIAPAAPGASAPTPPPADEATGPGVAPAAPEPPDAALAPRPPPPRPAPPPPVYRPAPRPQGQARPPSLFMLAGGLGLAVPTGDAEPGTAMSDVITPQFLMELEAGLRLTPALMLGLVLDIGVGDAASDARARCRNEWGSSDCTGIALHFALQARYTFAPYAPATPWIALGVGAEATGLGGSGSDDQLIYSGSQFPRLSAGYDFRGAYGSGWGFFGTVAFGRYSTVQVRSVDYDLGDRSTHGWVMVGVRAILGN